VAVAVGRNVTQMRPVGAAGLRRLEFARSTVTLTMNVGETPLTIEAKSRQDRAQAYFMVDDTGLAWMPGQTTSARVVAGHIRRDRAAILSQLIAHLEASQPTPVG
jgi:hypothetical protein